MQDRFERFVVSITELHRYLQKLKELEMGQMDLKAGYTMCLYYLGKHPELYKVDEYVDDGYSGTNFERPDFKRMMQDIEKRNVNCIIVKDLSRFGRNYIETGRYLERIFPFMGSGIGTIP